jgi:CRISPR-associated endonuclease/helicase Cas3
MAGEPPPGGSSTGYLETALGILSYAELAPRLAERVLRLERLIFADQFADQTLSPEFLCELHDGIAGDLAPDWAGRWRAVAVCVGSHEPPPPHQVPLRMRDFTDDLQMRLACLPPNPDDLLLETLAFAEGRLLSIHPFADFNGRVTRLFLTELLHRLRLPPVALAPSQPADEAEYLAALRAGDTGDWQPLMAVWRRRFEQGFPLLG